MNFIGKLHEQKILVDWNVIGKNYLTIVFSQLKQKVLVDWNDFGGKSFR